MIFNQIANASKYSLLYGFVFWSQKKGGNVKTIPPYKPVNRGVESSDPSSSPEKESENVSMIPLVSIYNRITLECLFLFPRRVLF